MLNLLLPMGGKTQFFEGSLYPKQLYEINGNPMIQHVIDRLSEIKHEKRFIFVVNVSDCIKFHIDDTLRLLTDDRSIIVQQAGAAKGSVCSCLLGIEHIDNDEPLLISNSDIVISADLTQIINRFIDTDVDAGVVCFDSVHPKWSYVRVSDDQLVVEAAEKRPISRNAIAGIYYYRRGKDFVRSAKKSLYREALPDGLYYIAPTMNEMILEGKRVGIQRIENTDFHSLYSLEKVDEFKKFINHSNSVGEHHAR